MRHINLPILCSLVLAAQAEAIDLTSPDGIMYCLISTSAEGHLLYSVTQGGQQRLEPEQAGVIVDNVDLGAKVALGEPRTRSISEAFPWRGNKTTATNNCRASEIPVRTQSGVDWVLETRVFDDGVGFRYRVPGTGTRRIQGESTSCQLPKDCTVWFQTDTVNYEGAYQSCSAGEIPLEKEVRGKKQPVHLGMPVTLAYSVGTFGLINEASLYKYSGMTLRPEVDAKLRAAFEDDPNGWSNEGAIVSPWRVIVLAKDLNALVNNDVIASLCEPPDPKLFPAGIDTPWLRPGKAPCTWMVFGNDGAQWDRQKWFVDVAAATGCEYLLVDGGWQSEKWGWLKNGGDLWGRAAELCRYAEERKVGILLWHAYPEGREDGPGLTTEESREKLFQNCQKAGVKGVKIDFFDSESRAVVDAYEDLMRRAAEHQIMVNFHGANKPTGEMRTWPNVMTREGIREQEYVLWGSLPLQHYGALPFTRMAAGHGDFLPGYVQSKFLRNTTSIFQMASVIVFSTPFLCWPDNPEAYLNSPLLQFIRTVPVTWDETRILPGSAIGDTVIMARRKGVEWYVAVLNCRSEAQSLDLDLVSLGLAGKEMTLYRDGQEKPAFQIESGIKPPGNGKISASLPPGGGLMAHLYPPKGFGGWK
jgi:hypothetical protein